jgi:hypothetical protein
MSLFPAKEHQVNPMRRLAISLSLTTFLFTAALAAADVNGKWTGQVPRRGGELSESTFTFKVDGDKLTGTVTTPQGERPVIDGKVTGDTLSFSVEDSQRGPSAYKGTLSGDEIKFTRTSSGGQAREFTAKRPK